MCPVVFVQDRVPPLKVGTAVLVKIGVGEKTDWKEGEHLALGTGTV